MVAALTDDRWGGFQRKHCSVVADPTSALDVSRLLRRQAALATDTFVVYYAGHGLTGPAHNDLYLALGGTDVDHLRVSALSFDLIREVFLDCPAVNRVLILDCCYSGRAARGFMGEPISGQVEISGTYTLTSAPPNSLSRAPVGATHTAFTDELLTLLRDGIPDGPELLDLRTLYARLSTGMVSKGYPKPAQRGTDSADRLALTRNPALHQTGTSADEPAPEDSAVRPDRKPRVPKIGVLATILAVVIAGFWVLLGTADLWNKPSSGQPGSPTTSSPSPPAQETTQSIGPPPAGNQEPPTAEPPSTVKSQRVSVYNNHPTRRDIADTAVADLRKLGWTSVDIWNYQPKVPKTAVFFRPGTAEESAARILATELGLRAEARFTDIENDDAGIIVIVTADYTSPSSSPVPPAGQ
ncbi:hypothetical protein H4W33_004988 [Kibdelosporangium phytohabitans]|nr:hypothetical protein [Kibdelosporangium phytohabitans]